MTLPGTYFFPNTSPPPTSIHPPPPPKRYGTKSHTGGQRVENLQDEAKPSCAGYPSLGLEFSLEGRSKIRHMIWNMY